MNREPVPVSLESLPAPSAPHLVADWLELVCLADPDGEASLQRLVAARHPERDTGRAGAEADVDIALVELTGGEDDVPINDELDVNEETPALETVTTSDVLSLYFNDPPGADDAGQQPDPGDQPGRDLASRDPDADPQAPPRSVTPRGTEELADVWTLLNERRTILGPSYPFALAESKSLSLVQPPSSQQRMYLLLLLASNLGRLPREIWPELTRAFERLGAYVLMGWLGGSYRVELFGTAAYAEDRYYGDLREALERLGQDLNWPLHPDVKPELASGGDRGLDVVGWRPLAARDAADLWVTYFAQCGCGKEWRGKQDEPHASRWRRLLAIKGPLQPVLMIPYWQRRPGGAWHSSSWLSVDNVTLDRQRILGLIRSQHPHSVVPPVIWRPLAPAS